MKIWRISAMALTAALGFAIGCGGTNPACAGTNLNAGSNAPTVSCGPGTMAINGVCQLAGSVQSN